jgi:hypothetical protein
MVLETDNDAHIFDDDDDDNDAHSQFVCVTADADSVSYPNTWKTTF